MEHTEYEIALLCEIAFYYAKKNYKRDRELWRVNNNGKDFDDMPKFYRAILEYARNKEELASELQDIYETIDDEKLMKNLFISFLSN